MAILGKAVVAAALAVTLLLVGAVVRDGTPRDPATRSEGAAGAVLVADPAGVSLAGSVEALQERLRRVPGDWRGFASLGLAAVARARTSGDPSWYRTAEAALAESLRLHGRDNAEAELGLGILALARHDFAAALTHGRRAARIDPYDADAYGVIGDALVELGRYEEAFAAFQTMVDTRPDLASYARVSYARELIGDVEGAERAMRLAFEAAGTAADAAWAAHQLGELALGSGDVGTAAGWYRRGHALDPAYVPNLAGLGKVAWARGSVDLAIRRYREVVERMPAPEHVVALAELYMVTGRTELAAEQENVVRAMHELAAANGVNVDLELALFDADHGHPRAALAAARAEWARRRSVHVADALAWALYANGRYERAARLADRALELGTPNALFRFHAGMIRLALGQEARARELLREALRTNPSFSILHRATAQRTLAELEATR
jgi:tetratricopeptide (TPR) repeat protein